ncbi:DUF4189 domain-containing protein [Nocardia arthritidis]|uniref:DUF4189 domain-containing protein n=1 Tax=Nocardia arthritidis TaxID=228602 RepID=UPI00142D28DE|nr:DUF4189 domain-containing protein [Nocardia arthritidis]
MATVTPAMVALMVAGAGTAHAAGDLYGAIAVAYSYNHSAPFSHFTGVGEAVDYPTQEAANQAATQACRGERCGVIVLVHNECGAVAEYDAWAAWTNSVQPVYSWGKGATAAAAKQAAMDMGNQGLTAPSTAALFTVGLARIDKPLFVLDTICTANAG